MPLVEYFLKEFSAQLGYPVLLYEFQLRVDVIGQSSSEAITWRFCNLDRDFIWQGETWYASAIKNSRILQSSDINRDGVNLEFPRTDEFARQFVGYVPEFPTLLTIYRGHLTQDDDEYVVYWKGRVGGGKLSKNIITLGCESIFTSTRRYGLRARYTRTCRHVLYSTGCGLNSLDWGVAGDATAATTHTVTSAVFLTQPDGWWISGMLQDASGALRYIVDHAGNMVTLWRPLFRILDDIEANGTAEIVAYPGCNKTFETCGTKFSNQTNFGGFFRLPNRNPLDGRSIV